MNLSVKHPPLSASFKGSFAYKTVKDRMPIIVTKAIDYLCREKHKIIAQYGEESEEDLKHIIGQLSKLRSEMQTNKPLQKFCSSEPDLKLWDKYHYHYSQIQIVKWFDSPWLYVECFMYRKIADIFRNSSYLQPLDPFKQQKEEGFNNSFQLVKDLGEHVWDKLQNDENNADDFFTQIMEVSLWGNRNDLSISAGNTEVNSHNILDDADRFKSNIIVNDLSYLKEYLDQVKVDKGTTEVAFVLDNAGIELVADLCLADYLLTHKFFSKARFYVKKFPWFVSDVTFNDFHWTLKQLIERGNTLQLLAEKWEKYLTTNQWEIAVEDYWTLHLPYYLMKEEDPELYKKLSQSKLVIFKGDLNYRKLGADLQWPYTESFHNFLQGFQPAPLVVMRTLKAEIICGLPKGKAEELQEISEDWLVSGNYGVIQFAKFAC